MGQVLGNVTATTRQIGEAVAQRLRAFRIKYASKVKGLGLAMAAGTKQALVHGLPSKLQPSTAHAMSL